MNYKLLLTLLLTFILSCKSDKAPTHMNETTELVFSEDISLLISNQDNLKHLKTLVLDTKVNCEEINELCEVSFFQNLEYLLFYNLDCNALPSHFKNLHHLEKLIINSTTLDHLPEVLLSLPALKHLQLDVMKYQTYEGSIPSNCVLEELEFQSTPVENLGNLVNIPTLKSVGIEDHSTLKVKNENIHLLVH